MNILVNALSTTNTSGRQVVVGHFSRLLRWAGTGDRFVFLHHERNADIRDCLDGPAVEWIRCPPWTAHWFGRALWERVRLPAIARRVGADLVFMTSGTVVETCAVPQVSLAMNPWCLVPEVHESAGDRTKAWLQRRAYASAVRRASWMAYLSGYMRDAYERNAGLAGKDSVIAYAGLSDDILAAAAREGARQRHEPLRIVSVSLMAPHKGVETLLHAFATLRQRQGLAAARLHLVGGWPDTAYAAAMRRLVAELGVTENVDITGFVSRQALFEHYAKASVFCLMSRCESFGIPAVEAQTFGTPVVSSNGCAIPEVCGEGGVYPQPGDAVGTADALRQVLTDQATWQRLSAAARQNAAKYTYDQTAKPLMRMFGRRPES